MIEKHLRKLRARDEVTAEEERVLRALVAEVREVPAKATVIRARQRLTTSTLLLEGLMCRYKDLSEGQRQISELHVAGDFVDLHSFTLKRLDHNIMALTACKIAVVPHERLRALSHDHPHLTRLYWFTTNMDAAVHREWELSLGRRSAVARIAQLLAEMHVRLGLVGLTDGLEFRLPLTQVDLAECVGLTPVHVNRTLKLLREDGAVDMQRGRVRILDLARLHAIAEFNPDYLYLENEPR
ncbi:Crp/Fnr family transcriptional regulator [Sphingomonas sp. JC676]|uniref:Crp/Fnr family transcriptional regulator n=1 Tax=Sphingomonas sp. JC676 TaxID=2768065 RepID=UPI001657F389|nr:Crp/Fnr family transcriptional regulator [Sphingomonas sp. JC676]MBC9033824.1 Crp/Fnr family transcriptional regulator [Sphingomonas sp. JC676]